MHWLVDILKLTFIIIILMIKIKELVLDRVKKN